MDPISAIILGLIWAALRAPGEAGRSMRQDYRSRRERWNSRAENRMGGRGRGGRRVAGFDRNGRAYRPGDRNRQHGRRRGDPGWRTDSRAWTGPEGRARVARGVLPSAVRTGIVAGALAYTAVFGLGVAASGFRRGLAGGYRMGKQHYLGKRNQAQDPTATVTPGTPGEQPGPDDEVIDAVIVDDPNTDTAEAPETTAEQADTEAQPDVEAQASEPAAEQPDVEAEDADSAEARALSDWIYRAGQSIDDALAANGLSRNGWLLSHFVPGSTTPIARTLIADEAELDRKLAAGTGLRVEIRRLSEVPDHEMRDLLWHTPAQPETQASRPPTAAGSATPAGGANVTDYEWQCPGCGEPAVEDAPDRWTQAYGPAPRFSHYDGEPLCPVMGPNGYEPAQPEPRDPRPGTSPAGPTNPGGTSMSETTVSRTGLANPGSAAQFVAVGAGSTISAPVLMEGANFDAHLHNLEVIAKEATHEYNSAELTLASASAARQRAEHAMTAVEQMAVGLAAQDFGDAHVGNMATLHDLLSRQVAQARTAEHAAQESLATAEQVITVCVAAAATFKRDHGQLAEAHASAPHAAKTREAYQPM
jgi:hypothetical protein